MGSGVRTWISAFGSQDLDRWVWVSEFDLCVLVLGFGSLDLGFMIWIFGFGCQDFYQMVWVSGFHLCIWVSGFGS